MKVPRGKPYQYKLLQDREIRLLKLSPASSIEDKLVGELGTWTLTISDDPDVEDDPSMDPGDQQNPSSIDVRPTDSLEAPPFDALSYVWGGEDLTAEEEKEVDFIELINSYPGNKPPKHNPYLMIGSNLKSALSRFRLGISQGQHLHLWVDAICMDQTRDEEKSVQISKMSAIYGSATTVRVWLGNDDGGDGIVAFNFIRRILSFMNFDAIVNDPANTSEWNAFKNLLQKPWFKRRWIVQEIAFAKHAMVYCGRNECPWDSLRGAIGLFASVSDRLRQTFQKSEQTEYNPYHLGEIEAYGAIALVEVLPKLFRSSRGHIMDHLLSLESLLTALTPFEAKRPHDFVYAIMRISSDARPRSKNTVVHSSQIENDQPDHLGQHGGHNEGRGTDPELGYNNGLRASPEPLNGTNGSFNHLSPSRASNNADHEEGRGRQRERDHHHSHIDLEGSRSRAAARSPSRSPAFARRQADKGHRKAPRAFLVNYNQSMLALCTDVVKFAAERSGSIDIICKPWVPTEKTRDTETFKEDVFLPSWMRTLDKRPYTFTPKSSDRNFSRIAANPLVGVSLHGLKSYSACGARKICPEHCKNGLIEGRTLNAYGFELNRISERADPALNGTIPDDWLSFVDWDDLKEPPPRPFWRTLVANRRYSEGPEQPPDYWPHACKWAFQHKPDEGNLDTQRLITDLAGRPCLHVLDFIHRMRAVVWDRRLIKVNERENEDELSQCSSECYQDCCDHCWLGLAPKEAKVGDRVCVLYGCSVPLLLRPLKRSPRRRKRTWASDEGQQFRGFGYRAGKKRQTTRSEIDQGAIPISVEPPSAETSPVRDVSVPNAGQSTPDINVPHSKGDAALSPPGSPGETFTLVGECYIDGMMDGEAFLQKRLRNIDEQLFRIGCPEDCGCEECCWR